MNKTKKQENNKQSGCFVSLLGYPELNRISDSSYKRLLKIIEQSLAEIEEREQNSTKKVPP